MPSPPSPDSTIEQARALWFPAAGECELRDEVVNAPGKHEVLVRTLYSGISRGTESLVFRGKVPEQEQERMRGPQMAGEFTFPVKYGYASVGRVEQGLAGLVGKHVFALHPHQSVFVTAGSGVTRLPAGLPPERAVLAANMETALNIIWDAKVLPGDNVAVFGAGVVGTLTAYLASRIPGTRVALVDPNPARQSIADSLCIPFGDGDRLTGEFDVLINASASARALQTAIDLAGVEARIVEASWYGDTPVELSLGGTFHSKRLSMISSQVGAVPSDRRSRWSYSRRLSKAMDLLKDDCLDVLISGETGFEDIVSAYPNILSDPDTLCHRIRY